MSCEAGYLELRTLFDFLNAKGIVGPALAGEPSSSNGEISIAVVDADDMLDKPAKMIEAFCKEVGIEYKPEMLFWDTEEDHQFATEKFEKWIGFHDDAIQSTSLRARAHAQVVCLHDQFKWQVTDMFEQRRRKRGRRKTRNGDGSLGTMAKKPSDRASTKAFRTTSTSGNSQ